MGLDDTWDVGLVRRDALTHYDPKKPVISFHVPKAGGSSLREYMDNFFDVVLPHYNYQENIAGIDVWKLPTRWQVKSLKRLARKRRVCIHGHFRRSQKSFYDDYYPDADQFITLLRDPLEMTISQYYYAKRLESEGGKKVRHSLDTFVASHTSSWDDHLPVGFVDDTQNAIKGFLAVGTLERVDLYLDRLAEVTGRRPAEPFPHANTSPRGKPPSEAAVAEWMKQNWRIVESYDTVRSFAEARPFQSRPALRFNGILERFLAGLRPYSSPK